MQRFAAPAPTVATALLLGKTSTRQDHKSGRSQEEDLADDWPEASEVAHAQVVTYAKGNRPDTSREELWNKRNSNEENDRGSDKDGLQHHER